MRKRRVGVTDAGTIIHSPGSVSVFESDTVVKKVNVVMDEAEQNQRFLALVFAKNAPAAAERIAAMFGLTPQPSDIQRADVLRDFEALGVCA